MYITPNIGENRLKIVAETQKKIYGEVYNITEKRAKNLLEEKAQQQADIKIIMEDKQYKQYKSYFRDLKNQLAPYQNVTIENDKKMKTNYVHAKFFVTDTNSIIQTANLTHAWLFNNKEHMFITKDEGIRKSLQTIIEKDLNGEMIKQEDIHQNILICNINCRPIIENLLKSAKKNIIIETQYITDPSIIKIIQSQSKNQNTDIHIIVANTAENDDLTYQIPKKIRKKYNAKPYLHTKTILIDDKILLIGSMNLSTNSLDNNREVGIMLTDKHIIEQFKKDFFYDRSL